MGAVKKLLADDERVLEAFKPYENFCRAMLDAYVVVNLAGKIIKANQLLTQLFFAKTKQILKANSFDEFISLRINDKPLTVNDMLAISMPTRIDEVKGKTSMQENLNLIIGIFPFFDAANQKLGAFLLLRDVTAETNLQFKYKDAANKSITDALTGLFTRGYFNDYLKLKMRSMEAQPADSEERLLSIIMIDIDFFKKVNDVHGHQAGDHILKITAGVIKKCFRKTDVCCRYGGEEFLVILPATDVKGALLVGEKLRAMIASEVIEFEGKTIPITVSAGVAQVRLGQETVTETMARADAALYQAKKTGRNKVLEAE